eukprot:TRINITY_DN228_c0_g2_i1.p1 TRINITY_DN228_c0_g2~~TRINITY_DN228_c0_g2_i1.p1  ORF type:complete len:339 (-),score=66.20 TRINITY_DN228_c0_g2_i1:98-1114(-)
MQTTYRVGNTGVAVSTQPGAATISTPHHQVRFYTRPMMVGHGITTNAAYTSRAISAVAGGLATSPFYVVQTLAQVRSKEGRKSYAQICEDIMAKEGVLGFFRGSLVGVARFAATAGLNYAIYLGVRRLLEDRQGVISLDNHQIANAVSIILSSILTYPLEVIRTRLILDFDKRKYTGAIDCLTNTAHYEGWTSLFSGSVLASVGNYILLEATERIWAPVRIGLSLTPPAIVEAAAQTIIARTLYYPIETVLKMVQAPHLIKSLHPDVEFDGVVEAATNTVAKHGVLELWRGYAVAALSIAPFIAVVSLSYQGTAKLFSEVQDLQVPVPAVRVTKTTLA